jgi:hypothetical protein
LDADAQAPQLEQTFIRIDIRREASKIGLYPSREFGR